MAVPGDRSSNRNISIDDLPVGGGPGYVAPGSTKTEADNLAANAALQRYCSFDTGTPHAGHVIDTELSCIDGGSNAGVPAPAGGQLMVITIYDDPALLVPSVHVTGAKTAGGLGTVVHVSGGGNTLLVIPEAASGIFSLELTGDAGGRTVYVQAVPATAPQTGATAGQWLASAGLIVSNAFQQYTTT